MHERRCRRAEGLLPFGIIATGMGGPHSLLWEPQTTLKRRDKKLVAMGDELRELRVATDELHEELRARLVRLEGVPLK